MTSAAFGSKYIILYYLATCFHLFETIFPSMINHYMLNGTSNIYAIYVCPVVLPSYD